MGPIPGPSIFGIDTETIDKNHSYYVRDIPAARALGARYTHVTLEADTGTGNFSASDFEVKQARKNGMGVELSFGGVKSACSLHTTNYHDCPPTTSADLTHYEAYVRKMLVRYRNVVQYYESWVEPNNKTSWSSGPNPALYAKLLKAEWSVVQSVNSRYHTQLKLLFGSPIGFQVHNDPNWIGALQFTDEVLTDLGGAKVFDAAALHAYRLPSTIHNEAVSPNGEVCDYVKGVTVTVGFTTPGVCINAYRWLTWPQELQAYEQLFANHGYGQVPLWLTEFGWNGAASTGTGDVNTYAAQATDLTEAYNDLLALPFVQDAEWFNVRDYEPGIPSADPKYFYSYGLYGYRFTKKPAATAFESLAKANPGR